MRFTQVFLVLVAVVLWSGVERQTEAASVGLLIKHLSSLVKWSTSRPASKSLHQSEGNVLQFEDGYLVETVAEGNDLGVVPHSIRASRDGDLFAVDALSSNIVRITPPLSRYSRARLVAGSFQGHTGHVDGKPSDARFNRPKGVTVDDKGNVYVADTSNLAIRKIGDAGVTTIAGGKSSVAGYRDGPSEDAQFSGDFDVVFVRSTCSLLVIDRGNAALRRISLNRDDCDYESHSYMPTDLLLVAGAIVMGFISCKVQQGFLGSYFSSRMREQDGGKDDLVAKEAHPSFDGSMKDGKETTWPSFGQLFWDIGKLATEAIAGVVSQFAPSRFKELRGLTPLKDSLVMPEDDAETSRAAKQRTSAPLFETRQGHAASPRPMPADRFSEVKTPKIRSTGLKDGGSSSKHRSSRRQEYSEFYASGEASQHGQGQVRSKSHKDRSKDRDKNGDDASFGESSMLETKPGENKTTSYDKPRYEPYNFRSKFSESYRFE